MKSLRSIITFFFLAATGYAQYVFLGSLTNLSWERRGDANWAKFTPAAPAVDTNTIMLLHFDEEVGVTNFVDSSFLSHPVLTVGSAYATNGGKFGNAVRLSAAGYIKAGFTNPVFNFGSATDFTVDYWVWFYAPQPKPYPLVFGNNYGSWNNGDIAMRANSQERPNKIDVREWPGTYNLYGDATQASNTWHHGAFVRSGSLLYWFVNGELQMCKTGVVNRTFATGGPLIGGGNWDGVNSYWNGYLDELRVSRVARWTNNFTPPVSPYP